MQDIVIIGAGGFGREVKTLIDSINKNNKIYNFLGFYDDGIEKGKIINGFPILGSVSDLNKVSKPLYIALGLGDPITKSKVVASLSNTNLSFPSLIHPSVIISDDEVTIGNGCIICAGTIITCNIKIENFVR